MVGCANERLRSLFSGEILSPSCEELRDFLMQPYRGMAPKLTEKNIHNAAQQIITFRRFRVSKEPRYPASIFAKQQLPPSKHTSKDTERTQVMVYGSRLWAMAIKAKFRRRSSTGANFLTRRARQKTPFECYPNIFTVPPEAAGLNLV